VSQVGVKSKSSTMRQAALRPSVAPQLSPHDEQAVVAKARRRVLDVELPAVLDRQPEVAGERVPGRVAGAAALGRDLARAETEETERGQAHLLEEAFKLLQSRRRRWNIIGVNWFSLRDAPKKKSPCYGCPFTGLLERDGDPKRAWRAFKRFTSPGARFT
jgi:hypothetical protein